MIVHDARCSKIKIVMIGNLKLLGNVNGVDYGYMFCFVCVCVCVFEIPFLLYFFACSIYLISFLIS